MRARSKVLSVVDWAAYWSQRLLLDVYGPATQGRDRNPVERLKRDYGRPPSKYDAL